MKIRQGFVSNSSSTSFCIMGACVNISKEKLQEDGFHDFYELDGDDFETYKHPAAWSDDEFYIGIPIDKMKNDQTRQDFHDEVLERFYREFPFLHVKDVKIITGGWRDG